MAGEIEGRRGELEDARRTIHGLIEQIKLANQHWFGSRSEKVYPGQLSLFNDMEAASDPEVPEPSVDDVLPTKRSSRKHGGLRAIDYSRFETVVVEHEIVPADRACPKCGCELSEMKVEVTRRIRNNPRLLTITCIKQRYCLLIDDSIPIVRA